MKKIEAGKLGLIRANPERREFPNGAIVLVLSHNTPEQEYQVTEEIFNEPSAFNPYILENQNNGFKITKEQFDTGEFVKWDEVEPFTFEPKSQLQKFTEGVIFKAAMVLLSACTGGIAGALLSTL